MNKKHKSITKETRRLPSGTTFTRNRCTSCGSYWDTGHPRRKDEPENHHAGCPEKTDKKLEALALKISNDISECIDDGETREQLREVIRYWVDQYELEARDRSQAEWKLQQIRLARAVLDEALRK